MNEYFFQLQGNATDLGEFSVFRGKKNFQDLGRVVAWNGETENSVYSKYDCNEYRGTDYTVFPTYMDMNDGVWVS